MSSSVILQFVFATLLPVVVTIGLYLLQHRTAFGKQPFFVQQIVIGLVFGGVAIFGTEFGISTLDATMNVRDAAPLTAGLVFGWPAGVLAGIIGGVERWFAALWGRGMFTRLACSAATIFVGFYAGVLRKYVFDDKKPTASVAFGVGVVGEVLHLLLIFVTNAQQTERAFAVVRACAGPMILCNGISVMLCVFSVTLLSKEPLVYAPEQRPLTHSVQAWMLVVTIAGTMATALFTFSVQSSLMMEQTTALLKLNMEDASSAIGAASDASMLRATHGIAERIGSVDGSLSMDLAQVAHEFDAKEVCVVDGKGTIAASNTPELIGYRMKSRSQTAEFLALLGAGTNELAKPYRPSAYNGKVWRKCVGVSIDGGFVLAGFDAQGFQDDIAQQVTVIAEDRHVGESGGMFICDADGKVQSSYASADGIEFSDTGLGDVVSATKPGDLFVGDFEGAPTYGMYITKEGYRIVALLPVAEAEFSRNVAMLVSSFMEVLVFGALFAAAYSLVKILVVDKIMRINATLSDIMDGDLDVQVDVRTNKEFALLTDDINLTVGALKNTIADAEARIDAELEYARTIQRSALPMVFPPYPNRRDFQIYALMDPANEVGGDFYDFYLLDENHLVFLVADVSGKGIPAAMFMMRAKTVLKGLAESGLPVEEVLSRGNEELCEGNEAEMFVTCWMGVIDLLRGHVTFSNAGHNPPVLVHGIGSCELCATQPNMVLAGIEGMRYRRHELDMQPGDVLFLYTDGVTEATNSKDELFGETRLLKVLGTCANLDVEDICKSVHANVDEFVGAAPQFDDITALALQFVGGN